MAANTPQDPNRYKDQLRRLPPVRWSVLALRRLFPLHFRKQIRNFSLLSKNYGQLASMKEWSCVDGGGRVIPWYTYPAIEYLSHLDFSGRKVFEYGSGNSSIWWAAKCRSLTSIESDAQWYEKIRSAAAATGKINYRLALDKNSYVRQDEISEADVVIIDGLYRPECADFILSKISSGSWNPELLIFDNSDWYPKTIRRLDSGLPDWIQVDFSGFGPINEYTWTTSLFLNPSSSSRLVHAIPPSSIAGLAHVAEDDR